MIAETETPIAPGYRLDRYELLCPIAEGGMASVWIARLLGKHGFEKLVAIKTILPKFAGDEMFQRMFLDEARIASGIEHNNVAQVLDLGDERGVLYLVMEWVDGDSLLRLHRAVERKGLKIPYGVLLRILADACAGLHAAHELRGRDGQEQGVVHRDVSPQNILVAMKGVAKVIDFGIAKARDRVAGETSSGLLKGKVQYMAPEQALGGAVDRRADIWAIGVVLYHLVSGRLPFDAPNQLATLNLLSARRPPLPLPPGVPRSVRAIVQKALSFDPAGRYATALELQHALEQAMAEAGSATTADVAAFVAEHLADRAQTRRNTLDVALAEAAERSRVKAIRPDAADSGTADSGIGAAPPRSSVTTSARAAHENREATGVNTVALPSPHPPPAETSSASIGARAALSASMAAPVEPRTRTRHGVLAAGLTLAAAALLLVLALSSRSGLWGPAPTPATATQAKPAERAAPPPAVETPVSPPMPDPRTPPVASVTVVDAGTAQAPVALPRTTHAAEGARPQAAVVSPPPRGTGAPAQAGVKRGQGQGQEDYGF
jgi:serine/threonine-protein kinase